MPKSKGVTKPKPKAKKQIRKKPLKKTKEVESHFIQTSILAAKHTGTIDLEKLSEEFDLEIPEFLRRYE